MNPVQQTMNHIDAMRGGVDINQMVCSGLQHLPCDTKPVRLHHFLKLTEGVGAILGCGLVSLHSGSWHHGSGTYFVINISQCIVLYSIFSCQLLNDVAV